jgi:hypothetical protein
LCKNIELKCKHIQWLCEIEELREEVRKTFFHIFPLSNSQLATVCSTIYRWNAPFCETGALELFSVRFNETTYRTCIELIMLIDFFNPFYVMFCCWFGTLSSVFLMKRYYFQFAALYDICCNQNAIVGQLSLYA